MTEIIYIPFPKELYDRITIASEGTVSPAVVAENQVETWIDQTWNDQFNDNWTTNKGRKYLSQFYERNDALKYGDPEQGYQWKEVFLPNGTDIKMTYKGKTNYARIEHEKLSDGSGNKWVSPASWVFQIADHTSRNAWRDIWVKFPNTSKWEFAHDLRRRNKG